MIDKGGKNPEVQCLRHDGNESYGIWEVNGMERTVKGKGKREEVVSNESVMRPKGNVDIDDG